jgi:hypothetical protein
MTVESIRDDKTFYASRPIGKLPVTTSDECLTAHDFDPSFVAVGEIGPMMAYDASTGLPTGEKPIGPCPKCGSTFLVWSTVNRPLLECRCFKCLHYWEIQEAA